MDELPDTLLREILLRVDRSTLSKLCQISEKVNWFCKHDSKVSEDQYYLLISIHGQFRINEMNVVLSSIIKSPNELSLFDVIYQSRQHALSVFPQNYEIPYDFEEIIRYLDSLIVEEYLDEIKFEINGEEIEVTDTEFGMIVRKIRFDANKKTEAWDIYVDLADGYVEFVDISFI
mgnify:CR=1 FL=1